MKVNELKLQRSSFTIPGEVWDTLTTEQQDAMAIAAFETDRVMGTVVDVKWPATKEQG